MNDTGAKQQIVDKIKSSSNILVTVSTNPTVDELSAALGLTLMLNKMNKHATAVFSGAIPPAITFLDPQKTFENTVDSLRDFIIALDKEKADHLRYKVDGDVVKIFITPYRTTITGDDLEFSQGDYNVELVLALGVKNQDSLDSALAAHGRILHDATVATISVGDNKSELGSIGWREETASSLSEVLVSLSDSLKSDKALLDEQIATAYLTGIVAATDRFSNNRTSSRVMTVAAQLMGAGANQQLIASKLQDAHEIGPDSKPNDTDGGTGGSENSDGTTDLAEGESTKLKKSGGKKEAAKAVEEQKKADGELDISHEKKGDVDAVAEETAAEKQAEAAKAAEEELAKQTGGSPAPAQDIAAKEAEKNLAEQLSKTAPTATPSVADLRADLAAANEEVNEAASQTPASSNASPTNGAATVPSWNDTAEPAMGGTLNATTEQAADDSRRAAEDDRNRTILSHGEGYITDSGMPGYQSPLNSSTAPSEEPAVVDPFQSMTPPPMDDTAPTAYAAPVQPPVPTQTLEELDNQTRAPHEEARAAVNAAFDAAPAPTVQPMSPVNPFPESQPAAGTGSLPPLPPLPDFSTLPPLPQPGGAPAGPSGAVPPEKLEDIFGQTPAPASTAPTSNDPGQFKIPGQS
jgi:hypothetical protein